MTMWTTPRKLSWQKIDACFWKEPNIHYRKKKKALGENSQKSVSTSEAPWRETELSEGHKHPSWNVEETTKEEKLINHITILPHYHSSYQQSSSKDWLSPGAKQATSHPFLSKTQAKSSSAPKQVKLGPFCKCQDVITAPSPTGHRDAASWWQLWERGNAWRWQETPVCWHLYLSPPKPARVEGLTKLTCQPGSQLHTTGKTVQNKTWRLQSQWSDRHAKPRDNLVKTVSCPIPTINSS